MRGDPKPPVVLSRETLMPISVVASLLIGAFWIRGAMADVQHEVSLLRRDLSQMQVQDADRISKRELRAWILLLRAQNPTIQIPEPPG